MVGVNTLIGVKVGARVLLGVSVAAGTGVSVGTGVDLPLFCIIKTINATTANPAAIYHLIGSFFGTSIVI